jgi:hypothetical protein
MNPELRDIPAGDSSGTRRNCPAVGSGFPLSSFRTRRAMHFTKLGFFFAVLIILALAARLTRSADDVQVSRGTPAPTSDTTHSPAVASE